MFSLFLSLIMGRNSSNALMELRIALHVVQKTLPLCHGQWEIGSLRLELNFATLLHKRPPYIPLANSHDDKSQVLGASPIRVSLGGQV